tara:strand:- start:810 stop:1256 length:447 start_codon:yes stop_codon:yes gene_type:complete
MSVPTEFDFAQVLYGDGESPEVFTVICDVMDVTINHTAQTNDRFRRDCTKPGEVPKRAVKVTGEQWDISGSGILDSGQVAAIEALVGKHGNFQVIGYADDNTDAGAEIGTYEGEFVLTTYNNGISRDGDNSLQIDLASDGAITYTAAS